MNPQPMDSLRRALDLCAAKAAPAQFWLRDDDAVEPSAALDRMLRLTAHHAVPCTLAVIPAFTGAALAAALRPCPQISVAVHGWSHRSYAGQGQKNQELGNHRPRDAVLDQLGQGFDLLKSLYGAQFLPVLVPPWNRIDAGLLPGLGALGFGWLSVFGPETPAPIRQINTDVDLIDWRGSRATKPEAQLVAEIIARIPAGDMAGRMGFLTHHLVHDAAGWLFLEKLFAATAGHPGCHWQPLAVLMQKTP